MRSFRASISADTRSNGAKEPPVGPADYMGNSPRGKDVHRIMRFTRIALAVALALPAFATTARADVANGEQIVRNICASCHGFPPIGGPNLAPNNPSLIQFALNNVPAMSFLRGSLTSSDINDIAAYLG